MARGHYRYAMQPAGDIIRRLGGVRAVATALNISAESVSKWNRPHAQGGGDGRIPPRWWRRVLELVEKRGGKAARKQAYRQLYETAKPSTVGKEDPVHASKRKGDRFERQVVDDLNAEGVKAKRVPLSGAAPGWTGDVIAEGKDGEWKIQCKITTNRKNAAGADTGTAGRGAIVRLLSQVSWGLVEAGDATYVAMRRGVVIGMLKGVVPAAVNIPRLKIARAKMIADAIDGHDALVFRRDQAVEWMALVRQET